MSCHQLTKCLPRPGDGSGWGYGSTVAKKSVVPGPGLGMAGKVKSPSVTRASRSPSWLLDGLGRSMFINVANRLGDRLGRAMAGAR